MRSRFIRGQRGSSTSTVEGWRSARGGAGEHGLGDDDDLLEQAAGFVVVGWVHSMLQRQAEVGFARAGRIMDLMEEKGLVGAARKARRPATFALTWEEWEAPLSSPWSPTRRRRPGTVCPRAAAGRS